MTNASSGGFAATIPTGPRTWTESFGFTLCAESADAGIKLQRVTPHLGVPPLDVRVWIRRVPARAGEERFISAYGSPPRWREAYADTQYGGTWSDQLNGARIEQTCHDSDSRRAGFIQLVFVVTADHTGAEVRTATVDYTANGKAYRKQINWNMSLCGDAPALRQYCP